MLLLVPIAVPLVLATLGTSWLLAALGVFIRDLQAAVTGYYHTDVSKLYLLSLISRPAGVDPSSNLIRWLISFRARVTR